MADSKLKQAKLKFEKDIKNISKIGHQAEPPHNHQQNDGQSSSVYEIGNMIDQNFGEDESEEYAKLTMSPPGDSFRLEKKVDKPNPRQVQKNNGKVHEVPIVKNLDLGKITGMQEQVLMQEDESESMAHESDLDSQKEKNMA